MSVRVEQLRSTVPEPIAQDGDDLREVALDMGHAAKSLVGACLEPDGDFVVTTRIDDVFVQHIYEVAR